MTKAERETLKAEFITGDYRTLKEFAEAKGLSYDYLRQIAKNEKWVKDKAHTLSQQSHKIITKASEQTINRTVRSLAERNQSKLDAFVEIERKLLNMVKDSKTSMQIESILRAFRNMHEMEEDILAVDKTQEEQGKALEKLTAAIMTAAFDDTNGDDNNG